MERERRDDNAIARAGYCGAALLLACVAYGCSGPGGSLSGTVRSADGSELPKASVVIESNSGMRIPMRTWETGYYVTWWSHGGWRMRVTASAEGHRPVEVDIPWGDSTCDFTLVPTSGSEAAQSVALCKAS
jgi:hypothetical protein